MRHIAIGLLALGMLAGCSLPEAPKSVIPTVPTEIITLTPDGLWQEYKTNPVRAEEMMKNKRVRMTGTLVSINQGSGNSKTVSLGLMAVVADKAAIVMFTFPEAFRQDVAPLNPKQTVTLEGVFKQKVPLVDGLEFDGTAIVK